MKSSAAKSVPMVSIPETVVITDNQSSDTVSRSRTDRDRLCPVLAGVALVGSNRMTVRLVNREAEIKAPTALLKMVFHYCDGTHSFNEILQNCKDKQGSARLAAFMSDLLEAHVLVDAATGSRRQCASLISAALGD